MNQFNGNSSCIKCVQEGENHRTSSGGNIRIFPYSENNPIAPKQQNILVDAELAFTNVSPGNGVRDPTFISLHGTFDSVRGYP